MRQKKDYPNNHADSKREKARMAECVYAGPDFFARRSAQSMMFQTVYAGPEFFNPQNAQPDAPGSIPVEKPAEPAVKQTGRWCVSCGMPIPTDAKFCTECGAPQTENDA